MQPTVPRAISAEHTFRPSKNLYITYLVIGIILLPIFIGIGVIVAATLWYKYSYISLGDKGIHLHKGWLNVTDRQIPYEKINTVESQQTITDRLFGCGSLQIYTGNDIQGILFTGINQPKQVKKMIEDRIAQSSHLTSESAAHVSPSSSADELIKYAELMQKGIITKEEFETKKRQLLK